MKITYRGFHIITLGLEREHHPLSQLREMVDEAIGEMDEAEAQGERLPEWKTITHDGCSHDGLTVIICLRTNDILVMHTQDLPLTSGHFDPSDN